MVEERVVQNAEGGVGTGAGVGGFGHRYALRFVVFGMFARLGLGCFLALFCRAISGALALGLEVRCRRIGDALVDAIVEVSELPSSAAAATRR